MSYGHIQLNDLRVIMYAFGRPASNLFSRANRGALTVVHAELQPSKGNQHEQNHPSNPLASQPTAHSYDQTTYKCRSNNTRQQYLSILIIRNQERYLATN